MIKKRTKTIRDTKILLCLYVSTFFWITIILIPQISYSQQYPFITKWGSYGTGNGQFKTPSGIAVDQLGNLYVSDTINHRIQKFSINGTFLTKWGSYGTSNGQFLGPIGIAIDKSGDTYVLDSTGNNVQKFSINGTFLTKWGSSCDLSTGFGCKSINGSQIGEVGDGQFNKPQGIAIDSSSNIYVSDSTNGRIEKFNNNGTFLTKWDTKDPQFGLTDPRGIFLDALGKIYVSLGSNSINIYNSNGTFLTNFGSSCDLSTGFGCKSINGSQIGEVGDGQFNVPTGLTLDSMGRIYVADTLNNRIQVFDNNGTFLTKWGSYGTGNGQFYNPQWITINDHSNQIYVSDTNNNRIQIFTKPPL